MKRLIGIVILAAWFVVGCEDPGRDDPQPIGSAAESILNGSAPDPMSRPEHNAVVAIRYHDYVGGSTFVKRVCSGTIIAPRVVLTAAHCVASSLVYDVVAVNTTNEASPVERIRVVSRVVFHPELHGKAPSKHDLSGAEHDLALLVLTHPFSHVSPVPPLPRSLAIGEQELGKLTVNAVGFGWQSLVPKVSSGEKRQADVVVTQFWPPNTRDMLQFSYGRGMSLPGDSGGPSFVRRSEVVYVAGVHQSSNLTNRSRDVHVAAANEDGWIEEETNKCTANADCRAPTNPCQDVVCDGGRCEESPRSVPIPTKQGGCATGEKGVCATGHWVCAGGVLACQRDVEASNEVLDGVDNDCNGEVDEWGPGCHVGTQAITQITDLRDGTVYPVIELGGVCWLGRGMALTAGVTSWCLFDHAQCASRLYNWQSAATACPAGWHLPSSDEATALLAVSANPNNVCGHDPYRSLFENPGFAADMGVRNPGNGGYAYNNSSWCGDTTFGGLWTSSTNGVGGMPLALQYGYGTSYCASGCGVSPTSYAVLGARDALTGFSVRCVKD